MQNLKTHEFEPIFNKNSEILILGSFPSVISREQGFYYANPKNRFWKVLEILFKEQIKDDKASRINFLLKHKIALYDVAHSCEIIGSSDAKLTNVKPVNLEPIFINSKIKHIFLNGNKAYEICQKHLKEQILNHTKNAPIKLPSTSPANAKFSLERLLGEWKVIKSSVSK